VAGCGVNASGILKQSKYLIRHQKETKALPCHLTHLDFITDRQVVQLGNKKNAVSYSGASSTVGDPVLFECKAFTIDCSSIMRTKQ